jgi:hypothetical protein
VAVSGRRIAPQLLLGEADLLLVSFSTNIVCSLLAVSSSNATCLLFAWNALHRAPPYDSAGVLNWGGGGLFGLEVIAAWHFGELHY